MINLHTGLLAKESLVALPQEDDYSSVSSEMNVVCQRYTVGEEDWLQSPVIWNGRTIWNGGAGCLMICLCFGILAIAILFVTSSIECHQYLMKGIQWCLLINALLSLVPMLILFVADVCTSEYGVCDPSMTNCVGLCQMGTDSYYLCAACALWFFSSMTVEIYPLPSMEAVAEPEIRKEISTVL